MVDSGHIRAELSHITRLEFYGLDFLCCVDNYVVLMSQTADY